MKKVIIAALAVGLMSTTAMAEWHEGAVDFIQTTATGVKISIVKEDTSRLTYVVSATSVDTTKTIIAMALTAQADGRPLSLYETSATWTSVLLSKK